MCIFFTIYTAFRTFSLDLGRLISTPDTGGMEVIKYKKNIYASRIKKNGGKNIAKKTKNIGNRGLTYAYDDTMSIRYINKNRDKNV